MITLNPCEIASALDAAVIREGGTGYPSRGEIDSRAVTAGDLFFGLPGSSVDGGKFAGAALEAGAWGIVLGPKSGVRTADLPPSGWVFECPDPLAGLQKVALRWRHTLDAHTVGITGSAGKTSTKDILRALLGSRAHAGRENFNTEIGVPLTILEAGSETEHLVLEMAMRGHGQIAELARIAEPDAGAVINVGPVHTELLGSVEAIAAAKAELLDGLPDGATAVVPVNAGPLEPEIAARKEKLNVVRFGVGGNVRAERVRIGPAGLSAEVVSAGTARSPGPPQSARFDFPFRERHNLENALAAIALGIAAGRSVHELSHGAESVSLSRYRGERIQLAGDVTVVNDCYNANPIAMEAAIDSLAEAPAGRRIAVLGLMAELGPEAEYHHRRVGAHAREQGVDLVIGVGPGAAWYGSDIDSEDPQEAADRLATELRPGDLVLIKGSRSAGLEAVTESLRDRLGRADG